MRAVRLVNGRAAIPVRIEYLADRDDLVNALAWTERDSARDEPLPELTRGQVVGRVRDTLYHGGIETCAYWTDNVYEQERQDQLQSWAEACVERAYGAALRVVEDPLERG